MAYVENRPTALDEIRKGDVAKGLSPYDAHGRIVLSPTMADARRVMVAHWAEARESGRGALMLAVNRRDVEAP
jgi:hypothetical protein